MHLKLLFVYIFWNKVCPHNFKASSEEVIMMLSEKIKTKYMREDVWKNVFHKITGWLLATSLQINFVKYDFQRFWLDSTFRWLLFVLVQNTWKLLWNSFLFYILADNFEHMCYISIEFTERQLVLSCSFFIT